jgi:hypothetical protein
MIPGLVVNTVSVDAIQTQRFYLIPGHPYSEVKSKIKFVWLQKKG